MGEVNFKSIGQLERFVGEDLTQAAVVASSKAMRRAKVTMVKQAGIELRKYYNLKAKHAKEQFLSKAFVKSKFIEDHHAIVYASAKSVELIKFMTPSAISKMSQSQKGIPIKKRPKARIQIRKGHSIRFNPRFIYEKNGVKKVGLRSNNVKSHRPQYAPSASAFMERITNSNTVLEAGFQTYKKQFISFYKNHALWYGKKRMRTNYTKR